MNITTMTKIKNRLSKGLLAAALLVGLNGFGQTFSGTYGYTGTLGDVMSYAYDGTAIANLTPSALQKIGVTSSGSSNNFRANDWPLSSTVDLNKYFEFTLTANNGFLLTNPTINFGIGRSATGPRTWEWRSSVDNFATPISLSVVNAGLTEVSGVITNPDANSTWPGNSLMLSTNNQNSITFRFYGYNSEGIPGTGGFQGQLSFGGTLVPPTTWNGSTSTDWNTASNWTPAVIPSSSDNIVIPAGTPNAPIVSNLTIDATKTMTVNTGANLTVSGVLTNNGTITLQSSVTLVQGMASTTTGSGTWNVQQAVTGNGTTSSTVGRFWYMGSPVSGATAAAFDPAGPNRLFTYAESANAWTEVMTNMPTLMPGLGYAPIFDANTTVNFTGGTINNGTLNSGSLSYTGALTTSGYNLISNPYPSYTDWDLVFPASTGVESTIWYQTKDGSGAKVFDTYNATGGVGTTNSGNPVNSHIPPMQGFWTRVSGAAGSTGTVNFTNAMRTHQATGGGLKKGATDFPAFVRLDLEDGDAIDQTLVYFHSDAQNQKDAFDSEKMFVEGASQVYTTIENLKFTMNGFSEANAPTEVPLTLVFNGDKEFTLRANELHSNTGIVFLEDKVSNAMHNLLTNESYTFFANEGTVADRFVLHFGANVALSLTENKGDEIVILANTKGNVTVKLSESLAANGTITVLDGAGRIVSQQTINDKTTQIQLNENSGMYFVQVSNGEAIARQKIVIAK